MLTLKDKCNDFYQKNEKYIVDTCISLLNVGACVLYAIITDDVSAKYKNLKNMVDNFRHDYEEILSKQLNNDYLEGHQAPVDHNNYWACLYYISHAIKIYICFEDQALFTQLFKDENFYIQPSKVKDIKYIDCIPLNDEGLDRVYYTIYELLGFMGKVIDLGNQNPSREFCQILSDNTIKELYGYFTVSDANNIGSWILKLEIYKRDINCYLSSCEKMKNDKYMQLSLCTIERINIFLENLKDVFYQKGYQPQKKNFLCITVTINKASTKKEPTDTSSEMVEVEDDEFFDALDSVYGQSVVPVSVLSDVNLTDIDKTKSSNIHQCSIL